MLTRVFGSLLATLGSELRGRRVRNARRKSGVIQLSADDHARSADAPARKQVRARSFGHLGNEALAGEPFTTRPGRESPKARFGDPLGESKKSSER